jgi:transcriptional regulator
MYSLPYFKESDPQEVLDFMRRHPFAMLLGCMQNRPVATQVPLLIAESGNKIMLRGHIMRQTDHHKAFVANNQVLCVFSGAHSYVSASWYQDQQTASTWNYMSVHARGRLRFLEQDQLMQVLEETTALFENNPDSPSLFHKLSGDYVQKLASAIVAFEMEVESLENVFKLSQNRDRKSYEHIIAQLEQGDPDAQRVAAEMHKRTRKLFS